MRPSFHACKPINYRLLLLRLTVLQYVRRAGACRGERQTAKVHKSRVGGEEEEERAHSGKRGGGERGEVRFFVGKWRRDRRRTERGKGGEGGAAAIERGGGEEGRKEIPTHIFSFSFSLSVRAVVTLFWGYEHHRRQALRKEEIEKEIEQPSKQAENGSGWGKERK